MALDKEFHTNESTDLLQGKKRKARYGKRKYTQDKGERILKM